ncbi:hypothetical protein CYMTET_18077 [Cymbomonas tetramitiformis]|uniref:Uncharacterized protein n=1 Tax=Cymbomonas tetramitiformis TaxID=36881 RepID=A0AAE0G8T8_9CHLO|nr:hypothetical protein CYMTET_18077 [Cymbomonas tetramitiformis]
MPTRDKRKLLKESDLEAAIRLQDAVRNSSTPQTPPVLRPPDPRSDDDDAVKAERQHYLDQCKLVKDVFQDAADCGPDAFAAAIGVHGAPAVLTAGGAAAELDMSAYGFSVPAENGAGYGTLAARLDDLVSATSV